MTGRKFRPQIWALVPLSGGLQERIMEQHCHEHGHGRSGSPRPNRKLLISIAVLAAVYMASFLPPLAALHASLSAYLLLISWAVAVKS